MKSCYSFNRYCKNKIYFNRQSLCNAKICFIKTNVIVQFVENLGICVSLSYELHMAYIYSSFLRFAIGTTF